MEPHISDAIRILNRAYQNCPVEFINTKRSIEHAIRYLANPDRYARPKRGASNVKGGKRRGKPVA